MGESPVVIGFPHSGTEVPSELCGNIRLEDEEAQRTIRAGCDYAAPGFLDSELAKKCSIVRARVARVVLDVNRGEGDTDPLSVEGSSGVNKPHGRIWRSSFGQVNDLSQKRDATFHDILRRPYAKAEYDHLVETLYSPYFQAVQRQMRTAKERNGWAVYLDMHTLPRNGVELMDTGRHQGAYVFAPRVEKGHFSPTALPDFMYIDNGGLSGDPAIEKVILEEAGLADRIADHGSGPFLGNMGSPVIYGDPKNRKFVVGFETIGNDVEPQRLAGVQEVDLAEVASLRSMFTKIIERISKLNLAETERP